MKNLRVAYSRSNGIIGRAIRWFTRSNVNHTLFLLDVDGVEMAIGADWNGFVMQTRDHFERDSVIVAVPALVESIDTGIPFLLERLDTPYDYAGLLGMPWVLAGRFWFHRRWQNPFQSSKALFCSEVAAEMFQAVGYPQAKALDPRSTDPGLLLAWQKQVYEDRFDVECCA